MEFFKIKRNIPFMRHAKVFNIISLITFLLAVGLLVGRGLHFSIEFLGGTVMEVSYDHTAEPERIRAALQAGYERAWGTILDSNVTTLIAGIALFLFVSGPVRGFAVVHCLGILTSIFSAVVVSRGLVNLIYGGRKKVQKLSIGDTSWHREHDVKPDKKVAV